LGGHSLAYDFSTSTVESPTSGQVRFNFTTYASVTQIWIYDTDRFGASTDSFLDKIASGDEIKIFSEASQNKYCLYSINSIFDRGSYHELYVSYVSANSTFTNGEDVGISFLMKGDSGSVGATGPSGAGFNWAGAYNLGSTYSGSGAVKDVVLYDGGAWVAEQDVPTFEYPAALSAYWDLMVEQGDTGPSGPSGPPGPSGASGAQGNDGDPGSKWYSGTGAPSEPTGYAIGDWYLDDANGNVYEKTGSSTWTLRDNLTGPQGSQGLAGSAGPTGPTGPAGGFAIKYRFDPSQSMTDPGSGDLRLNGSTFANTSRISVDIYDQNGINQTNLYESLNANSYVMVYSEGSPTAEYAIYEFTAAPTVFTGYVTMWVNDVGVSSNFFEDYETVNLAIAPGGDTGAAGAMGPAGPTGPVGSDGSKWLNGAGSPSVGDGDAGDYYINDTNGIYYLKVDASTWSIQGNLTGPSGAQGVSGAQGPIGPQGNDGADGRTIHSGSGGPGTIPGVVNGDFYIDTTNWDIYGPYSSGWGAGTEIIGPVGPTGATGATGPASPLTGRWWDGSSNPTAGTGSVDDYYLNTSTGWLWKKTGASTWSQLYEFNQSGLK
jgi:hypothetical protein